MRIEFFLFMLVGCIIGGAIGAYVGRTKDRQTEGMLFGVLLGPLGWIIVLLIPAVDKSTADFAMKAEQALFLRRQEAIRRRPAGAPSGRKAADEEWNKAVNGE